VLTWRLSGQSFRESRSPKAICGVEGISPGITDFTASAIYRTQIAAEPKDGSNSLPAASLVIRGRGFFFQSCAHCHGQDADGGEDAPSLLKLQITGAHMALVIRSGIKDEMPSFARKYNEQETAAIVAYLKTLH
jgi:mono/diheme cytochrome c family protein